MSIREKIIIKSKEEVEKRLEEIEFLLNANPLSRIIEIRKEAQQLLEDHPTIEERTSDSFMKKIEELSKQEKEQLEIQKKTSNSLALIDEKVSLTSELEQLNRELFYLDRLKSARENYASKQ